MSIALRWTVGDVSSRGFEALALSIEAAVQAFGSTADYVVCVNVISVDDARRATGPIARRVEWLDATARLPGWLAPFCKDVDGSGMYWKLAPVRLFPDRHELSLDNDVILWEVPESVERWAAAPDQLLIAEDVAGHYGSFAHLCGPEPRNAGIRGLPPDFDAETRLRRMVERHGRLLTHDCDEQGMQVALVQAERHEVVTVEEVSICGYFRPHSLYPGRCGAHFVGVNSKKLPWEWKGHSGEYYVHRFWDLMKAGIEQKVRAGSRLRLPARGVEVRTQI